jgi:hypothetical protein
MRTIFLVGTAYCGSTVLSREFARDSRVDMMGEIDRLPIFAQWSGYPQEHHTARCRVCAVGGREHECPVFNEELFAQASHGSLGARYSAVRQRFGAPIAIDGSKNPWWMRQVVLDTPDIEPAAIILARLPWAFAFSATHDDQTSYLSWAPVWRDTYQNALRIVADLGIPSLVLRYEDFILNRRAGDAAVARLFGFSLENDRPPAVGLHHAVGGNLGGFMAMQGLDEAAAFREASGKHAPERFKVTMPELRSEQLLLTERWRGAFTVADFSGMLSVPGVWDTAHTLGYDLLYHLQRD